MNGPPATRPHTSVLAESRLPEAELCEVRDHAGDLVRTCSVGRGKAIVEAGLGRYTGKNGRHVELYAAHSGTRRTFAPDASITTRRVPHSRTIEHDFRRCKNWNRTGVGTKTNGR